MQKILSSIILITASIQFSSAQGCSDAGACSISDFKHDGQHNWKDAETSYLKFGVNFGLADYDIGVVGAYTEYGKQLNEKLGVKIKLTGLSQNGNSISSTGLSDVFITSSYQLKWISLAGGIKIPLSDGNKQQNGLPLPMDYQSSLGTYDLILGFGDGDGKWIWSLSYQQPLTQNNNQFTASLYPEGSIFRSIPTTNDFDRAADLLARVSYPWDLGDKFVLTPSALPIYHLRNDRFTNEQGIVQEIENSNGLTFNVNVFLDYVVNEQSSLQLSVAAPLLVREIRPDGLTRGFVANIEYRVRF